MFKIWHVDVMDCEFESDYNSPAPTPVVFQKKWQGCRFVDKRIPDCGFNVREIKIHKTGLNYVVQFSFSPICSLPDVSLYRNGPFSKMNYTTLLSTNTVLSMQTTRGYEDNDIMNTVHEQISIHHFGLEASPGQ